MHAIESHLIRTLLEYVDAEAPELLTASRWLAIDPKMAPLILGEDARQPSTTELARLVELIEAAPIEVAAAGRALFAARNSIVAEIDVGLERLLTAGEQGWSHPTEILGRPCPDFAQLLAGCRARLDTAVGKCRRRLESIHEKLERAVRVDAKARRRRTRGRSRA